jgi:hypothetical protein
MDNVKGLGKATFGLIPGLGGWADSTFTVTSAQDAAAEATKTATEKAKEQADQAKATQDAIEALTNAVLASFNSQLAYEDAQGKTTKAIGAYVDAAVEAGNAAGTSTELNDKYKASMNDAEQAALAQAAGAAKLAEDTAKAKGETITATEKNDAMRASLLDVANALGPNDPLRAALFAYIAQLGQIPADAHTDVTADTSQAEKAISNLMGSIRSFVLPHNTVLGASVSSAPSAAAAPTGAGGPSATTTAAAPGLPGAITPTFTPAGGGGNTTIVYNAPPGVNAADVVRVLNRWTTQRGAVATAGATGL